MRTHYIYFLIYIKPIEYMLQIVADLKGPEGEGGGSGGENKDGGGGSTGSGAPLPVAAAADIFAMAPVDR